MGVDLARHGHEIVGIASLKIMSLEKTGLSSTSTAIPPEANRRMAIFTLTIFLGDQLTKLIVLKSLGFQQEYVLVEGFFKFVHWGNTGAAYSLLTGNNEFLAIVSLVALLALFLARRHFEIHHKVGQIALGLMFGGILGNVTDRILPSRNHVIDFIYFYTYQRGGSEIGFPAFNIADTAICTGVGLILLLSFQTGLSPDSRKPSVNASEAGD